MLEECEGPMSDTPERDIPRKQPAASCRLLFIAEVPSPEQARS